MSIILHLKPELEREVEQEADKLGQNAALFLIALLAAFAKTTLSPAENRIEYDLCDDVVAEALRAFRKDQSSAKGQDYPEIQPRDPWEAMLDSFDEGDENEQHDTLEILQKSLDADRPGQRRIFGAGYNDPVKVDV